MLLSEQVDNIGVISEEDRLRADLYRFLADMMLSAPVGARLTKYAALQGDESELGKAFSAFAKVASATSKSESIEEYEALFIGMGRGELLPYASYYLTGFLNEKPLAKLRNTMRDLGITKKQDVSEPEDHMGSVMEIMSGMIDGYYGRTFAVEQQKSFFNDHVISWAVPFFKDLEKAKMSRLYQPVGAIGRLFMDIEATAFTMD